MPVDYSNAETLSRAQAWLALPLNDRHQPAGLAELAALYSLATGAQAGSCRHCQFSDYSTAVRIYVRQSLRLLDPELMADSQYTLAPGYENETLVHERFSEVVKADTLTDKAAEFFIENGMAHVFLKNGKKIGEEAPAEAKPKRLKADYQAEYKQLLGTEPDGKLTIEQLTEAMDAKRAELDKQD